MSQTDAIATVTLNRPHRKNAVNAGMWRSLAAAFTRLGEDPEVRVVVLTGAGGDFCAGADLSGSPGEAHPLEAMRQVNRVATLLHEMPKPTVAKVSGVAVGAGWNMALACDLVIAATDARFCQIFAKRGLSLDFGGSWLLPRLAGMQRAARLALLAEFVSGREAYDLGLAAWAVEPGELDAFAGHIAAKLAAGPPVALARTKALLHAGSSSTMSQALEAEAVSQVANFAYADTAAAFEAFASRTEPVFTGRWSREPAKSS
ncbi:enoyl-CoA hydratase/isomerase family protein [Planotetraspora sp. GP83]|uniref:enoyl-CoA hydratase/isomerase family protein n=1 Tax=Planotetraspora sp. GP83 TaxID=3156264 RepID=UPI0035182C00